MSDSDDVKPYTREELVACEQAMRDEYAFLRQSMTERDERLLATARAGLEDRERLADTREVLAHAIDVLTSAMADAGIVRDSSRGSMYEQIAHELRRSREDRERLDWLAANPAKVGYAYGYHGASSQWTSTDASHVVTPRESLRAAIDAARGGEKP